MELKDFLVESNKIEGISSPVTVAQMYEAQQFLKLKELTLESVCDFVEIFQPNARLREYAGLNVRKVTMRRLLVVQLLRNVCQLFL